MKIIITFFLCLLSFSCLAATDNLPNATTQISYVKNGCGNAPSTTDATFCASFKAIAICHCINDGKLPEGMCQDVNQIYQRMIGLFGSQKRACEYQRDTGYQECMDDWDCYRKGGVNSAGGICHGPTTVPTGRPCE